MIVEADRTRCIGAGQCVLAAPELFDQDDDEGLVMLLDPSPGSDRMAGARQAVLTCPASAITVRED